VLLAGVVAYALIGQPRQQQRQGGRFARDASIPVPVLVAPAKTADAPVYLDGVGTTRALNLVTVRSQVDGTLTRVAFREGQDVKKGDVLAQIDPITYQAQLDQAVAKKALDEAQLANARIDLERYSNLVKTNAVTKQQVDTQRALVSQLEAQVRLDQGQIDNAKAYVNYTTIVSPIDGRTGIRQVDEGNIIHASDTNGLVVITQIKPIATLFTLPQQQLSEVNKAFAQGPLTVEALRSDDKSVVDRGTLTVINNQVDATTGTVQLKAEFPNEQLQQWPGQFIDVRLLIETLKNVVVVPTAAVQRGPNGAFVYVVQGDGSTVAMRQVTVTQQNEMQAVIGKGLAGTERVVTTGFVNLTDGGRIVISSGEAAGASAGESKAAPRNGERPRRNGQGRNRDGGSSSNP
jgi:multidrug efflux system membrane fusion protein